MISIYSEAQLTLVWLGADNELFTITIWRLDLIAEP